MNYKSITPGAFLSRPNRFIAMVDIEGTVETCHVKNTGRCKELLLPGVTVYLEHSDNPARKTKYSLIAVRKRDTLINMDSQAPNQAAYEWLASGHLFPDLALLRREVTFGDSRFDLYAESTKPDRKIFMEVKGVTLEDDGVARFPDAPTERGVKHIYELCKAAEAGYEAYLLFVIQMKGIKYMEPNDVTHKAFGDALRYAASHGVHVLAVDCVVTPSSMLIDEFVEVRL